MSGFAGCMTTGVVTNFRSGASLAHHGCRLLALAVMASVWGCAHSDVVTGLAPRLTPTADTLGVRSMMDPVSSVPIAATSTPAPKWITFRFGPHVSSSNPPALFVVDGKVIGRRDDGSIDHVVAGRWFRTIDPLRIEAIEVVKGEHAVRRFGPIARSGAVLFFTRVDSSRARVRTP